jgi:hypothetical protein
MYKAVAIVALVLAADSEPTGYFQSARWGMSKDQVQMLFPDAHRTKVEAVLCNERRTSIGSVVVEFRYFFFGPKGLIGVSLYGPRENKSDESLLATFRSRYGREDASADLPPPAQGRKYSWQLSEADVDLLLYVSKDGKNGWRADYAQHGQHNAMSRLTQQVIDSDRF